MTTSAQAVPARPIDAEAARSAQRLAVQRLAAAHLEYRQAHRAAEEAIMAPKAEYAAAVRAESVAAALLANRALDAVTAWQAVQVAEGSPNV